LLSPEGGDSDTDISAPVVSYLLQFSPEEMSESTHTRTQPWFAGILNVHDVTPEAAMFAWSVYPFAVVIDIPRVEVPDG
jgi:hypothetical protein